MEERVRRQEDGAYRWNCAVGIEYHRRGAMAGLVACLLMAGAFLLFGLYLVIRSGFRDPLWIIFPVPAVILVIALPLLYLYWNAENPHEQYEMTDQYVKSGYGKSSVFSVFDKTKRVTLFPEYIEIIAGHRTQRIYVPEEDMEFVRDFILERIPDSAVVTRTEELQADG